MIEGHRQQGRTERDSQFEVAIQRERRGTISPATEAFAHEVIGPGPQPHAAHESGDDGTGSQRGAAEGEREHLCPRHLVHQRRHSGGERHRVDQPRSDGARGFGIGGVGNFGRSSGHQVACSGRGEGRQLKTVGTGMLEKVVLSERVSAPHRIRPRPHRQFVFPCGHVLRVCRYTSQKSPTATCDAY